MKTLLTISAILICYTGFAQQKGVSMRMAEKPVPITVVVSVVADTLKIDNAEKIKFVSVDGQTFMLLPESAKTKPPALAQKWTKAGKQIIWRKKTIIQ